MLNRTGITEEMRLLAFDELVDFLEQWQKQRWSDLDRTDSASLTIYPDDYPDDLLIIREI